MADQELDGLLTGLLGGEAEAFDRLVRLTHPGVYRLALRLLRHADDAQEAAQETFLAVYQGIGGFQGRAGLRTWLWAIAYRKCMDRLRGRARDPLLLAGGLDDAEMRAAAVSVQQFTDWGTTPESHYNDQEVRQALETALSRVTVEARAIFELRDIQGFSSQEVSAILGIREGTVRVRLHRVRQFLMAELEHFFAGRNAK